MSSMQSAVTEEQRRQYREEGYFLLPSILSDTDVDLLRSGAAYSIAKADAAMDARGTDRLGINARGRRYFSNKVAQERRELRSFLFGELMADVCTSRTSPAGLRSTTSASRTARSTSFRIRRQASAPTSGMSRTRTSMTWSATSAPPRAFRSRSPRAASPVSAAWCSTAAGPT